MRFFSCHTLLILLGVDKAALLISEVKEKSSNPPPDYQLIWR
jgi:hypothetical protein